MSPEHDWSAKIKSVWLWPLSPRKSTLAQGHHVSSTHTSLCIKVSQRQSHAGSLTNHRDSHDPSNFGGADGTDTHSLGPGDEGGPSFRK